MSKLLSGLTSRYKALHPDASNESLDLIDRAYEVAKKAHEGQLRKSGDPYITHPVAVAEILADIGLDSSAISAALLHDTVEDTGYTQIGRAHV